MIITAQTNNIVIGFAEFTALFSDTIVIKVSAHSHPTNHTQKRYTN